jgi:hypothetical protein
MDNKGDPQLSLDSTNATAWKIDAASRPGLKPYGRRVKGPIDLAGLLALFRVGSKAAVPVFSPPDARQVGFGIPLPSSPKRPRQSGP